MSVSRDLKTYYTIFELTRREAKRSEVRDSAQMRSYAYTHTYTSPQKIDRNAELDEIIIVY